MNYRFFLMVTKQKLNTSVYNGKWECECSPLFSLGTVRLFSTRKPTGLSFTSFGMSHRDYSHRFSVFCCCLSFVCLFYVPSVLSLGLPHPNLGFSTPYSVTYTFCNPLIQRGLLHNKCRVRGWNLRYSLEQARSSDCSAYTDSIMTTSLINAPFGLYAL